MGERQPMISYLTKNKPENLDVVENDTQNHEKRFGNDRRQRIIPPLRFLVFGGRRRQVRREQDMKGIAIMDSYSQSLFAVIIGILCLSLIDAVLTLHLIGHGAQEINPIMAYFLDKGTGIFIIAKYVLTSVAVVIILLVKNTYLPRTRVRSKNLFTFAIVAFSLVITWEIWLFFMLMTRPY
jgi:hypothetical protein